ncbi:hypothetical protein EV426DRAFT_581820 [Tirmania nivea]|nr:hypothetical protein EV426DRAFT_581820 [Tirmania nivea]
MPTKQHLLHLQQLTRARMMQALFLAMLTWICKTLDIMIPVMIMVILSGRKIYKILTLKITGCPTMSKTVVIVHLRRHNIYGIT